MKERRVVSSSANGSFVHAVVQLIFQQFTYPFIAHKFMVDRQGSQSVDIKTILILQARDQGFEPISAHH